MAVWATYLGSNEESEVSPVPGAPVLGLLQVLVHPISPADGETGQRVVSRKGRILGRQCRAAVQQDLRGRQNRRGEMSEPWWKKAPPQTSPAPVEEPPPDAQLFDGALSDGPMPSEKSRCAFDGCATSPAHLIAGKTGVAQACGAHVEEVRKMLGS
ncbi:MAG: hypothetical protein ACREP9_10880 [Candidatus Dormibacteraceae bacterium]